MYLRILCIHCMNIVHASRSMVLSNLLECTCDGLKHDIKKCSLDCLEKKCGLISWCVCVCVCVCAVRVCVRVCVRVRVRYLNITVVCPLLFESIST